MSGEALRQARKQRGWTQVEAGARLGVSQAYLALLENGRRPVTDELARKAVREFKLSPVLMPVTGTQHSAFGTRRQQKLRSREAGKLRSERQNKRSFDFAQDARNSGWRRQGAARPSWQRQQNDMLARDLGRLGYPGFAYMRGGWLKNPGEVLLTALAQQNLDSRLAEALPWLVLHYSDVDSDWLVTQARLLNLTNRLGFVVDLARRVLERSNETNSPRYQGLTHLAETLRSGRLAIEDTFDQESLTETERNWLRANRPPEAQFWNLLTNWQAEFLQYT
jgi:transcriptional regulator with XRE-family HTH domain